MREADKLICDILVHDLQIDSGRVVVKGQNWNPPKDNNLYIIVSIRDSRILSSTNKIKDSKEENNVVSYYKIDIDITSKNREAIERKEEVIMALTGYYSQTLQETNSSRIFRVGQALDLSFIEAASAMTRFRVSCMVSQIKTKLSNIDYFDKFYNPKLEVES